MADKCVCEECRWQGTMNQLLKAPNPFDADDQIVACPNCKTISSSVRVACMFAGCFEVATCGTPTSDGYQHLCGKHWRSKA